MVGKLIVCKFKGSSVEFGIGTFSLRFHSPFTLPLKKGTPPLIPNALIGWTHFPLGPQDETIVRTTHNPKNKKREKKQHFLAGMKKGNSPNMRERVKSKINGTVSCFGNNVWLNQFFRWPKYLESRVLDTPGCSSANALRINTLSDSSKQWKAFNRYRAWRKTSCGWWPQVFDLEWDHLYHVIMVGDTENNAATFKVSHYGNLSHSLTQCVAFQTLKCM